MNFREATDGLFDRIDHAQLADALGVSVASIRQARLTPSAKAYREPPKGWEKAGIRLAENQMLHFQRLVAAIKKGDR
jgi:hypothetical protein